VATVEPSSRTVVRVVVLVVLSAFALYVVYRLRTIIAWLVVAAFIAACASGPVIVLQRRMRRGRAAPARRSDDRADRTTSGQPARVRGGPEADDPFEAFLEKRPEHEARALRRAGDRTAEAVSGAVAGALFQATVAGITAFVMLTILGIPSALTLALIIAVLDRRDHLDDLRDRLPAVRELRHPAACPEQGGC
jgi:predicted PurR-regulated permease PerM